MNKIIHKLFPSPVFQFKVDNFELQNLINNCKCLISCHGAPSHIASSYNIKLIDIIDNSEKVFFESYNFAPQTRKQ